MRRARREGKGREEGFDALRIACINGQPMCSRHGTTLDPSLTAAYLGL
jgi:hypothetical protein